MRNIVVGVPLVRGRGNFSQREGQLIRDIVVELQVNLVLWGFYLVELFGFLMALIIWRGLQWIIWDTLFLVHRRFI